MATAKEWGTPGADRLRELFGRVESFTIGAEEEVLLVDPETFDLRPAGGELVSRLADPATYREELSAAQLEIVTPVCRSAGEVARSLAEGRRRAIEAAGGAVRLAAAGAHPFAEPWAEVGSGERFQRILHEHRWGARTGALAAGIHIHLGVPGADRALAVFDALRGYMPELSALAAAAPYFAGRDTGFASIRPKLSDALPHQGVAPAAVSWESHAAIIDQGRRAGAHRDPAELWWECRLHLRLGTIEVRAPDAQASLADVEAVAAVAHCLAAWLAGRHDQAEPLPVHAAGMIEENRWRAARDGVDAELIDLARGEPVAARDRLASLLDDLSAVASRLGAEQGLARAARLVELSGSARQREVASRAGLPRLVEWLADRTERLDG